MSLLVGERNLISFQEDPCDVFDPVRKRIRNGRGHIRDRGPDYLAYAILDVIVGHYFIVFEELGTRTEELEDLIVEEEVRDMQDSIHELRRALIFMRRMTWPMRELMYQIERLDSPLWADNNRPYVRDTYDHVVHVLDLVEALRDTSSGRSLGLRWPLARLKRGGAGLSGSSKSGDSQAWSWQKATPTKGSGWPYKRSSQVLSGSDVNRTSGATFSTKPRRSILQTTLRTLPSLRHRSNIHPGTEIGGSSPCPTP